MLRPNFYLVGFPKCGTSAIATYLAEHSQVRFSKDKEPQYHATDYEDPSRRHVTTEAAYLAQFGEPTPGIRIVAEGSVVYVYSKIAIANCLKFSGAARFAVMVRNPVDLVLSLHAQNVKDTREDTVALRDAWELSDARAAGNSVPRRAVPEVLVRYKDCAKVGTYTEQLMALVPAGNLKILFYEEFSNNPGRVYSELTAWLGLDEEQRDDFAVVNPRGFNRSASLAETLAEPPKLALGAAKLLRKTFGLERLNLARRLRQLNFKAGSVSADPALLEEIAIHYRPEVRKLETLVGRSLSPLGYRSA